MVLHRWGIVSYESARDKMQKVHVLARKDGQNHLIFCSHPKIFTVGSEGGEWPIATVRTDRGGSITCHSEGQLVSYFCFQARKPPLFYRRVLNAYRGLFDEVLPKALYDKERPGFYVGRRKIASLGFRYSEGVSLHGVALNVDVDLKFHALVSPCNLEGVVPTSLFAEGVALSMEEVESLLIEKISEAFDDPLQT